MSPECGGHVREQRVLREHQAAVIHAPHACHGCSTDLGGAPVVGTATPQVVDILHPTLIATDHVAEQRCCTCPCVTAGEFLADATGPTCWGPSVKAVVSSVICN